MARILLFGWLVGQGDERTGPLSLSASGARSLPERRRRARAGSMPSGERASSREAAARQREQV